MARQRKLSPERKAFITHNKYHLSSLGISSSFNSDIARASSFDMPLFRQFL